MKPATVFLLCHGFLTGAIIAIVDPDFYKHWFHFAGEVGFMFWCYTGGYATGLLRGLDWNEHPKATR